MRCSIGSRDYFLFGMRLAFGIWLLYVGLFKWFGMGPTAFVGFISSDFEKTWSPAALNTALAWLILLAEPVAGLLLLAGIRPRLSWSLTALLMFLLVIGQTMLMKPDVIANWQYFVLTLVCAALSEESNTDAERAS
ncbi:MAG: DoxX family membrane protein [Bdellovibrionota bacterium]